MFFEFKQNNTGGSFVIDEERGLSVVVIVEADDYEDANDRAERLGIYFDGCDDGMDCPCCGDRWYAQWSSDKGDEVPSHYGTPLIDVAPNPEYPSLGALNWAGESPDCFVHLKDGRKFGFHKIEGRYVYRGDPSALVEALPSAAPREIEA